MLLLIWLFLCLDTKRQKPDRHCTARKSLPAEGKYLNRSFPEINRNTTRCQYILKMCFTYFLFFEEEQLNEFSNLCGFHSHKEIQPQLMGPSYIQLPLFLSNKHMCIHTQTNQLFLCRRELGLYQLILNTEALIQSSLFKIMQTRFSAAVQINQVKKILKSCGGIKTMIEIKCITKQ